MKRPILSILNILAVTTALAVNAASADAAQLTKKRLATAKINKPVIGLSAGKSSGTGQADLVVLPWHGGNSGQPNTGFCGPWNGGNQKVYFYIKNIGSAQAPVSDVQVNFGGNNHSIVTVTSLAPNQQTLRSKTIPLSAWGPTQYNNSADFLIAADHNDDVNESNVANNYGQSSCLGPVT